LSTPRLTVRGVHHAFARREVLAGINVVVDGGQVVALVGPSGCGKTTLLHLCAGMLRPSEGLIENGFATNVVRTSTTPTAMAIVSGMSHHACRSRSATGDQASVLGFSRRSRIFAFLPRRSRR